MPRGEFGNTWEFAIKALQAHWNKVHNGVAIEAGGMRPINCVVCRGLWYRASHVLEPERATPIPYDVIVAKSGLGFTAAT